MGNQCPDDADMGQSARGAAAQGKPDHRPPDAAEADLVAPVGAVLATADQVFQHEVSPGTMRQTSHCGIFLPECAAGMVYIRSALAGTMTGPDGLSRQA